MKDKLNLEEEISNLLDRYNSCYDNYKRLLNLTQKQNERIVDEDYINLEEITDQKQKIITKIEQIQKKINTLRKKLSDEFDLVNNEEFIHNLLKEDIPYKSEMKQLRDEIVELIAKLQKLDKDNQELLQEKKDKLQQELNKLKQGKKVYNSYNIKNNNREGKFFDNKG
nr:flagellar protein FlgN [Halanaerobacter jeridensis]